MVHAPAAGGGRRPRSCAGSRRARPLVLLTGHTHVQSFRSSTNFVELNGGTVGGGGTGNLEKTQPFGLAVLIYAREGGFEPEAADLVEIDAHRGSARAERRRVGQ